MIEYTYECEQCQYKFSIEQSITADYLKICSNCGASALQKVFEPATPFFYVDSVTTLGQQAERNAKKFGDEQCSLKRDKETKRLKDAKRQANQKKGGTPWWRDGSVSGLEKSAKPIDKITASQYAQQLKRLKDEN